MIAVDPNGAGGSDFNPYIIVIIVYGSDPTQRGSHSTQRVIDNLTASGDLVT